MDPNVLPADLPAPEDDGAGAHLVGAALPSVPLSATDGTRVDVAALAGRTVLYAYPRTGVPGEPALDEDWDLIPGARVLGLSTQDTAYQREAAGRLHLPFAILSDADLALTRALSLPTLEVAGQVLVRRLTLVVDDGVVTHVWYPVFPPHTHAEDVLAWLRSNPR